MINMQYRQMLRGKSMIRSMSEYASERAKEIGYDHVYDYSLGNPSVPCPGGYTRAMIELHQKAAPMSIHGYSPSLGLEEVRTAVAQSISRRFGIPYQAKHIFMTSGACEALAHAIRAVTRPGDDVVTIAPYFPEYMPYVNLAGASLKVVPADTEHFQIHFDALDELITEKTAAVLINTPNNPTGVVYHTETIQRLATLLYDKQEKYGHDIFLISDEPYREIVYQGADAPCVSRFYENTVVCYSFSKSLSVPGERIGYIAVHPSCRDADLFALICSQISRGIGHNCPSSSVQLAVAKVLEETSDLSVYETNRNLLYHALTEMGFSVVKPDGAFYLFPKALEPDAVSFCQKAKQYDLILVPSDSFGIPGYFRMAYCMDTDQVRRSIPVMQRFVREVYGNQP